MRSLTHCATFFWMLSTNCFSEIVFVSPSFDQICTGLSVYTFWLKRILYFNSSTASDVATPYWSTQSLTRFPRPAGNTPAVVNLPFLNNPSTVDCLSIFKTTICFSTALSNRAASFPTAYTSGKISNTCKPAFSTHPTRSYASFRSAHNKSTSIDNWEHFSPIGIRRVAIPFTIYFTHTVWIKA